VHVQTTQGINGNYYFIDPQGTHFEIFLIATKWVDKAKILGSSG
jgi:hypothetical protein